MPFHARIFHDCRYTHDQAFSRLLFMLCASVRCSGTNKLYSYVLHGFSFVSSQSRPPLNVRYRNVTPAAPVTGQFHTQLTFLGESVDADVIAELKHSDG